VCQNVGGYMHDCLPWSEIWEDTSPLSSPGVCATGHWSSVDRWPTPAWLSAVCVFGSKCPTEMWHSAGCNHFTHFPLRAVDWLIELLIIYTCRYRQGVDISFTVFFVCACLFVCTVKDFSAEDKAIRREILHGGSSASVTVQSRRRAWHVEV